MTAMEAAVWKRLDDEVNSAYKHGQSTVVVRVADVNVAMASVGRLRHRVDKLEKWLEEAP